MRECAEQVCARLRGICIRQRVSVKVTRRYGRRRSKKRRMSPWLSTVLLTVLEPYSYLHRQTYHVLGSAHSESLKPLSGCSARYHSVVKVQSNCLYRRQRLLVFSLSFQYLSDFGQHSVFHIDCLIVKQYGAVAICFRRPDCLEWSSRIRMEYA